MSDAEQRPGAADADAVRPRPQYGEYATPEEQRARIAQPEMTRLLETGQDPDALGGAAPADAPPATAAVAKNRFADRVATIALLAYGLVNVVTGIPSILDYGTYVTTVMGMAGVDAQLTDASAGRPWAIAAAVILAVGWLATAYISWRSMVRGRLTWWIPLTAGVVFTVIIGILLMVPIVSDPALFTAILDSAR